MQHWYLYSSVKQTVSGWLYPWTYVLSSYSLRRSISPVWWLKGAALYPVAAASFMRPFFGRYWTREVHVWKIYSSKYSLRRDIFSEHISYGAPEILVYKLFVCKQTVDRIYLILLWCLYNVNVRPRRHSWNRDTRSATPRLGSTVCEATAPTTGGRAMSRR